MGNDINTTPFNEKDFCNWIADIVLDTDNDDPVYGLKWDTFCELACRKLVNLGYLMIVGNQYIKKDLNNDDMRKIKYFEGEG